MNNHELQQQLAALIASVDEMRQEQRHILHWINQCSSRVEYLLERLRVIERQVKHQAGHDEKKPGYNR